MKRGVWSNVQIWVKGGINENIEIQNVEIVSVNVGIDQNVNIWALKGRLIKCLYFIANLGIDQNVGIWLKNKEWIRILKFEDKVENQ